MKTAAPPVALCPIQMLWVRGRLSRLELLSVRSFLAQGHPVHLYTYDQPDNLPSGVSVFPAGEIVPAELAPLNPAVPFAKGSMGAFSDYFRYQLLFSRGGWWADMDVVATKPFQGFPDIVLASTREETHGLIANGFVMRFPPGHAIPRACLCALEGRAIPELDISQTGPLLLHAIAGPAGVAAHCQSPEVFAPVPWNASGQFVQPFWRYTLDSFKHRLRRPHLVTRFTRHTVAVHLWNETWRHAGLDKNARYPGGCLYERLHRRFPT
jgi:hypothetical protein